MASKSLPVSPAITFAIVKKKGGLKMTTLNKIREITLENVSVEEANLIVCVFCSDYANEIFCGNCNEYKGIISNFIFSSCAHVGYLSIWANV